MKIIKSIPIIHSFVLGEKLKQNSIGFVPTMGALHQGHVSLIQKSKSENNLTIVSIFINPAQFNNPDDLTAYPVTLDADILLLQNEGCDVLFIPSLQEIYPTYPKINFIDLQLGKLNTELEAKYRPDHFNGVVTVLNILFNAIPANNGYFGEKDFQQILVIKQLVMQMKFSINIIECKTKRELDGLAMSSRNIRLSENERKDAALIYKTLCYVKENYKKEDINLLENALNIINESSFLKLEYLKIVNLRLEKVDFRKYNGELIACMAVYAGETRLIDNIKLN